MGDLPTPHVISTAITVFALIAGSFLTFVLIVHAIAMWRHRG